MMLNHDALIEALGACLRALYGPVEQSLPDHLVSLLDQLEFPGDLLASNRVTFGPGAASSVPMPAHRASAAPAHPA
jgi:hypothetical protein